MVRNLLTKLGKLILGLKLLEKTFVKFPKIRKIPTPLDRENLFTKFLKVRLKKKKLQGLPLQLTLE